MSCPPAETSKSRDFVTEEEFLRLPETTLRTELIDGVVVREPSPGFGHQAGVLRIARLLATWADVRSPRPDVCMGPLDIRFARGRILQPDVLVFLEPLTRPVAMPIDRAPDLSVEVVSTRHIHDRVTRRLVCADAGVRRVVDGRHQRVTSDRRPTVLGGARARPGVNELTVRCSCMQYHTCSAPPVHASSPWLPVDLS